MLLFPEPGIKRTFTFHLFCRLFAVGVFRLTVSHQESAGGVFFCSTEVKSVNLMLDLTFFIIAKLLKAPLNKLQTLQTSLSFFLVSPNFVCNLFPWVQSRGQSEDELTHSYSLRERNSSSPYLDFCWCDGLFSPGSLWVFWTNSASETQRKHRVSPVRTLIW